MSDTQTETQAETPSTEADPMDAVYTKFNVEDTANSFNPSPQPQPQAQPQPQPQMQEPSIPDPVLDTQGYKAWAARQQVDGQVLRAALQQVAGRLGQYELAQKKAAEEADIKRAVETVNSSLGESKLDPDMIEIALGAEARKDPRFLALWNNREKNPKAFNEGLKAFSQKIGKKFSVRSDPQIAENVRALKEATSTKATGAPEESATDRLGKLQGQDFQREWARLTQNTA